MLSWNRIDFFYRYLDMKKAIVLLSGGLDSTTCLAIAKEQGFLCYALSFDYGQRHITELQAALRIAENSAVAGHKIITLNPAEFACSSLTNPELAIPDFSPSNSIPSTYVPARNTIFLAYAIAYAEAIAAHDIFIGVSAIDYSNYPDCRPEFIKAFESMANLATRTGIEGEKIVLHAPLLNLSKAETVLLGSKLNVNYALTVSCYQATETGEACGRCDSCTLRRQGFLSAGLSDPTRYVE